jgi:hypothetical protein
MIDEEAAVVRKIWTVKAMARKRFQIKTRNYSLPTM